MALTLAGAPDAQGRQTRRDRTQRQAHHVQITPRQPVDRSKHLVLDRVPAGVIEWRTPTYVAGDFILLVLTHLHSRRHSPPPLQVIRTADGHARYDLMPPSA